MTNLASHTNSSQPTWYSSRYQNEIDFIWTHDPLFPYLLSFEIDDSDFSTSSDHKILISRWSFPYAFTGHTRHKCKTRRRIFNYKLMTNKTWQAFADQVSSNLISHNTPSTISTSESLETTWHKLQTSIINAALLHIPNKKFAVRNFHHSFSSKATLLHYNLKKT